MAEHRTLTGASLHEPKGADSAAANTTYFADGAGNGTWRKVSAADIDSSAKHTSAITVMLEPGTTTYYLPSPVTGVIEGFWTSGQVATNYNVTVQGTLLAVTGTPFAGSVFTSTVASPNVTPATSIQVDFSGAAQKVLLVINIRAT